MSVGPGSLYTNSEIKWTTQPMAKVFESETAQEMSSHLTLKLVNLDSKHGSFSLYKNIREVALFWSSIHLKLIIEVNIHKLIN